MGATFIHRGDCLDYVPPGDLPAGSIVVRERLLGIATTDIPAGTMGALQVTGVFDFPKVTGVGKHFAAGNWVYWNPAEELVTPDSNDGDMPPTPFIVVGKAVADTGDDAPLVRVRLFQ